jgi:probable phosphoglycerate mutase
MTSFPRNIRALEHGRDRTTIVLVRHGETEWNLSGRIQGHSDSALTGLGREQGRRAAERLAAMPITAVYSSDLGRAHDTADLIAAPHGLPVQALSDLRERCYGVFEGKNAEEIRASYADAFETWLTDRERLAPPGGETQEQLSERVMRALRGILEVRPGETVAVAAHGGPVKSALFAVLRIPIDSWDRTWVSNGSITILRGTPQELRLACFNDTSHLDLAQAPVPSAENDEEEDGDFR